MKRICFVTSARSEYGLLKWLMKEVDSSAFFELQIIATGGHLLREQGYTVEYIIEDGFRIDAEVDISLDTTSKQSIAASMGRMAEELSNVFVVLKPDYILVLGDRYELLPICNTAFVMGIPIIHLSGGDITEGAIDNGIRNAVTMLATYHFPGTQDSANNILRMRDTTENVWTVGEPGLDAFKREKLIDRQELAKDISVNENEEWVLLTYHPETLLGLDDNLIVIGNIFKALLSITDYTIIATYSNADFGGREINKYLESVSKTNSERIRVIPSLGTKRYLSLMKHVRFIIGNSSSGIIETPTLGKTVINIGNRQTGRHMCSNVLSCGGDLPSIMRTIEKAKDAGVDESDLTYWGDGNTAKKIIEILEKVL